MIGKLISIRGLLVLVVLIGLAMIINRATTVDVSATSGTTAVIVELQDDAAAIYKVKAEKAGGSVSPELPLTKVMRITVNPLTKVVSVKLL